MGRKRIDLVLVERGLFESRAKARAAIEAGRVEAGGRLVLRRSEMVEEGDPIAAEPAYPWVGRAALKLDHALSLWPIPTSGRRVVDIGASTGGFTEVALARGAAHVLAVDVGRDQLHPKLRGDPRVTSLEGTDARHLRSDQLGEFDLIVCDVSFISLTKALPAVLAAAPPGCDLVCLVKPQFEVGPDRVGRGGLVRDPEARQAALESAQVFLTDSGWMVREVAPSPITGGDGNVEFLLWAQKRPPA